MAPDDQDKKPIEPTKSTPPRAVQKPAPTQPAKPKVEEFKEPANLEKVTLAQVEQRLARITGKQPLQQQALKLKCREMGINIGINTTSGEFGGPYIRGADYIKLEAKVRLEQSVGNSHAQKGAAKPKNIRGGLV